MEAGQGEAQPSPILGTRAWGSRGSGVLPEHPAALLGVGWRPGAPLAQPAMAGVAFARKQGKVPSLGSHTECPAGPQLPL